MRPVGAGAGEGPAAAAPTAAELRRACVAFEGLLLTELMKSMRQTVPESALSGGLSQEVFTGMFDEQLAQQAAGNSGLGLGELLAAELAPAVGNGVAPEVDAWLQGPSWVRPVATVRPVLAEAQRFGAHRAGERPAECGAGHCGLDLAERRGTPVHSCGDGVVTAVGRQLDSAGGLVVEVRHRRGELSVTSRYLHLNAVRPDLAPGTPVAAGELLGEVGDTGRSARGAHLHFELKVGGGHTQTYIDPEGYLRGWSAPTNP